MAIEGRRRAAAGLVLVDGGLGQLHAAAAALEELGNHGSAAGVDRQARRMDLRLRAGRGADRVLDEFSPVLHLVQMVRDEAHRFAVTFHRTRRNASRMRSELDQIPGVGEKTVTKLLRISAAWNVVRQAPEAELARIAGPAVARRLREAFKTANARTREIRPVSWIS
jgi:excinuclease ABC subunit C